MKQRKFNALRRLEALRFSRGQFRLSIKPLDKSRRDTADGEEPVDDRRSMSLEAFWRFFHQRTPTVEGFGAPRLQELARPVRGGVVREALEFVAEQKRAGALKGILKHLGTPAALFFCDVFIPLEQAPARLRERWLEFIAVQLGALWALHLTHCHVVPRDVDAVERVQSLPIPFRDHVEPRLPYIAAREVESQSDIIGSCLEKSLQTLLGALIRDPGQSLVAADLVDDGEVGVATAPLDLIDADRLDTRQIPVGHCQQHCWFYRAIHDRSARVEGDGTIHPRQPLRPAGEEPTVACRHLPLAGPPRHTRDCQAATRASDPPHRVHEEHHHVPKPDEVGSFRCKPVLSVPLLATAPAHEPAVRPRLDVHLQNPPRPCEFDKHLRRADKGPERLYAIDNAAAPAKGLSKQLHLYRTKLDTFFPRCPAAGLRLQAEEPRRTRAHAVSGEPHQFAQAVTAYPGSPTPDCESASEAQAVSMHTPQMRAQQKHFRRPIRKLFLRTFTYGVK